MRRAGRDTKDSRIRFALALDPAPADVFQPHSFSEISIPVDLVNLGRRKNIPQTALASGIAQAIPKGAYSTIEDASHYSLFGECKPDAVAQSEKIGEPICSDGGGPSRPAIHKQLVDRVAQAFIRELKTVR